MLAETRNASACPVKNLQLLQSLEGERLLLRPLQADDADALVAAARDGELWNLPFHAGRTQAQFRTLQHHR